MKELEVQTYNFSVQGIGLIKSLEKDFPALVTRELKQNIGAVSLKYIDALNANENVDFANNLRECLSSAEKSSELLNSFGQIANENYNNQKDQLLTDSKTIIEKLNNIISKLIY